ncbi:hypothetical protein WJR50_16325 [Catalinimonas sp. 4WD22]|uniref:hypothetical protein n=1 Tax=Catalinimonas locisalis TaxID=3133978 RepID=UPI003100D6C7
MIKKALRLARTLSLDIVLGAVVGSMFIADYLQVYLPTLSLCALAMSVWLIYTTDHLSDAYKIPHTAHTFRHQFHQKHFKTLSQLLFIVATVGIILLTQLPINLILWGGGVLSLVGLYFLSIRWMNLQNVLHKEFVIAVLYSIGVFLAPIYMSGLTTSPTIWLLFIQYILLALCNLLIFSWYEKELDQLDFHISYATAVGDKTSVKSILTCIWLLYFITGAGVWLYHSDVQFLITQCIILCMVITLHCIFLFPSYFRQYEMYRSIADAVFLYPILYLIL